ncbi:MULTISPECIES: glycosyltransferase [Microbacterium]|uniref:glycosyltransferase n=1 Tax=Microbacterium TaxID=33882 RepID=UPI000903EB62|nr:MULTISPECIES: glycosyltransferase [Microbacterium]APF35147.1 glycosyltransferase [Microbacterium paludicola]POX65692.1 glycosyltransferase [Microbacterium sp. Ru50]
MKVLGVVTLVSPHGEYGGPVRVALNQLAALRDLGHDVVIAGAARGYDSLPSDVDGIPARLFPARTLIPGIGFAGIGSPALLRSLRRHVGEFDIVHVHAARDLVTLPAARVAGARGVATVLQTHGMIDESANPLAIPLDAALTRPALASARAVTYLTARERASLETISRGRARLVELPNGVPEAPAASPTGRELLYLARLAARKRPVQFVEAAARLAPEFPDARFRLVGPDEGEGDAVRAAIEASGHGERIRWEGALEPARTGERMRRASGYVLPAVDEPYPMSVLEAMSAGLPVVVTDTCGLAAAVRDAEAGFVTDGGFSSLVTAMRRLLADPADAHRRGQRGRMMTRERFTMPAIAERLVELYAR